VEISGPIVTDARVAPREQEKSLHALRIPAGHQHFQVGVRALAPDRIGVVDDEGSAPDMRQSFADAAARFENALPLIGDDNARCCAAPKVGLDLIGEMMDVDDGALDTGLGEAVQRMIEKRPSCKLDERLRNAVRQRTHARTKSRREHHRGVDRAFIRCFHIRSNLLWPAAAASRAGVRGGTKVGFIPCSKRLEIRMGEVAEQIALDAWQMCKIAMLAVAER